MFPGFLAINDYANKIGNIFQDSVMPLFSKKPHETHVPISHNDFKDYLWRIFVLLSIHIENKDKNYLYTKMKELYHSIVPDDFESAKLHLEEFEDYIIDYYEETEITEKEINFLRKSRSFLGSKIIHLGDTIIEILSFFENELRKSNEEKEGEENIELTDYIQNNEVTDDKISGIVKAYLYL